MTIRTPSRCLGRTRYHRTEAPLPPAAAFLGPKGETTTRKAMADALGQIAATFGGATHLASVELPNGRWLCVTTC